MSEFMLKAIIVDNEEPAIDILRILLERTGQIKVVGYFLDAAEALFNIQKLKPDVAFLDIEMPEISGMELAKGILAADDNIEIVFVTAYDQYALKAFRVNALDYLLKPLSFEAIEQTTARLLRRKGASSLVADNISGSSRVYCFGKLTVYGPDGDRPVKWRTSKAEELFAYMLQHLDCEVPKWKICEALWPEGNTEKVDIYLHTTIYKMKKVLSSANIPVNFTFINGCYWMSLPNVYIDMIEFDNIIDSNNSVAIDTISIDKIEMYEKAFSLYRNDYLEGNDYIWSLSRSGEYSKKCSQLAVTLAKYYIKKNAYASSERILSKALMKSPLDENFHELLLKIYFLKKDRIAFITHFRAVQELFRTELGIEPSPSIKALQQAFN